LDEVARHQRGGLPRPIVEPLSPEQRADLVERALTAGFATGRGTIAWAAKVFDVRCTVAQMARLFRKLELRRTVPRPISYRAATAAQAAWKKRP
jgi:transposase